ncbi:hypothetical protein T4D_8595 [Trichinella pseudospiralis]|uniref:Uncharacterized protein n=1 Tax=Trichinella pseudospiralis TaxID=6337 RepID=A0A0V1FUH7_TRIPS|nr:hypothetical protein T4D_8595 [Trichinella pseudospiralis]
MRKINAESELMIKVNTANIPLKIRNLDLLQHPALELPLNTTLLKQRKAMRAFLESVSSSSSMKEMYNQIYEIFTGIIAKAAKAFVNLNKAINPCYERTEMKMMDNIVVQ